MISALVAAGAGLIHGLHLLRSLTTSDHFGQCSALANSHKSPALVACGFPFWLLLLLLLFTAAEFLASTKDNKSTNSQPIDLQLLFTFESLCSRTHKKTFFPSSLVLFTRIVRNSVCAALFIYFHVRHGLVYILPFSSVP